MLPAALFFYEFIGREFNKISYGNGYRLHLTVNNGKRPDLRSIERIIETGQVTVAPKGFHDCESSFVVLKPCNRVSMLYLDFHGAVHCMTVNSCQGCYRNSGGQVQGHR